MIFRVSNTIPFVKKFPSNNIFFHPIFLHIFKVLLCFKLPNKMFFILLTMFQALKSPIIESDGDKPGKGDEDHLQDNTNLQHNHVLRKVGEISKAQIKEELGNQ